MPAVPVAEMREVRAGELIRTDAQVQLDLEEVSQDFMLRWKDLETPKRLALPLDFSPAAAAAFVVATAEDEIVLKGSKVTKAAGLLSARGAQKLAPGDWDAAGGILADVVRAIDALASATLSASQALVLEPGRANLELALGSEIRTAHIGNEGMDHLFRIIETVALRIKRPQSVVVMGKS